MAGARGAGAIWPGRGLYYGWVMLLTLSFTELTSWGILYYSFSVFVTPMQRELGWSRAALTGAFSLALLCSGVAALGVGRWLTPGLFRAINLLCALALGSFGLRLLWGLVRPLLA